MNTNFCCTWLIMTDWPLQQRELRLKTMFKICSTALTEAHAHRGRETRNSEWETLTQRERNSSTMTTLFFSKWSFIKNRHLHINSFQLSCCPFAKLRTTLHYLPTADVICNDCHFILWKWWSVTTWIIYTMLFAIKNESCFFMNLELDLKQNPVSLTLFRRAI